MPLLLSDRARLESPLPLMTTAEARMLGTALTPASWLRVRRGVYVDRAAFSRLPPWDRYAVRVHAFVRKHPDAILCLESAAVLHGLPSFGETAGIHVYDPGRSSSWSHGDVSVHTSRDHRAVTSVNGIAVTSLEDTVTDLARVLPPAQALAAVDSAISPGQGGTARLEDLRRLAGTQQNTRGRERLRWMWAHADERSESPAESVSRAVIVWSGFERPVLQQELRYEGATDRVDFFFPSCGAVGEADGWRKYRLDDPDAAAKALREEKLREDRLRRNGHPFARWDLRGAWLAEPMARALIAAGVPKKHPPHPAMLATLKQRPRERQRVAGAEHGT